MMLLFQNLIAKLISVNYGEAQKWQWSAKDRGGSLRYFLLDSARIFIPKPNNVKMITPQGMNA